MLRAVLDEYLGEALPLEEVCAERAISKVRQKTRWQPIDIVCRRADDAEVLVRTKPIRCFRSAAMCVSETIGLEALRLMGLTVAKPYAVNISARFADDITRQYDYTPSVQSGIHWGTEYLGSHVESLETLHGISEQLKRPETAFTIYLGDIVLANRDRKTYGNALYCVERQCLIPIDQSDCFNHPDCLTDVQCLDDNLNTPIASWLEGTEQLVMNAGADFAFNEVNRIKSLSASFPSAADFVPPEWYEKSRVDANAVKNFLRHRAENLDRIVDLSYWSGLMTMAGENYVLIG